MQSQLIEDGAPLRERILGGAIDHPQQRPRPLDVPQELVPQAVADVRPRNQAGHVRQERGPRLRLAVLAGDEDAQIRRGGCEGVWTDTRRRPRQRREERRLAGVRSAHDTDIGDRLQLQLDPAFLALIALLVMARRLVRGGGEVDVPTPATPAAGDHQAVAICYQLAEWVAVLDPHHCAGRHAQHELGPAAAVRA